MKIETALLHSVYREINELIGAENTTTLYEYFKGQQVTFPIHMYDPGLVKSAVAEKTLRRMLRE